MPNLLADMHRGNVRLDLEIAAQAIAATGLSNPSLLEIGCGSGYYAEVLATLIPGGVRYTGLDYSAPMIERARLAIRCSPMKSATPPGCATPMPPLTSFSTASH